MHRCWPTFYFVVPSQSSWLVPLSAALAGGSRQAMKIAALLTSVLGVCSGRRTDSPPVLAPFGAFAVPRLLNPFSGHLPPSPPPAFPWPRVVPLWRVRPRLRLTKRLKHGSFTCTCDIDGNPHLEARVREPVLGGHVVVGWPLFVRLGTGCGLGNPA